ncbi:predicted protein [Streptomyces iranensis]|uniref:Uncharacterized protein n=1 Tax=Streptomyces iranensis TaxID=576784 RepID=A0A061A4C0_9ACTN|nr:predicted protein [Streptomyces iranensis]
MRYLLGASVDGRVVRGSPLTVVVAADRFSRSG